MDFMILNRHRIKIIQPNIPHIVVSIREPENDYPDLPKNKNRLDNLQLCFTDEDSEEEMRYYGRLHQLMTDVQATQILEFIKKYKDQVNLIISQCDGGISRSAGTAAALSVILNGPKSDNWIFDNIGYVPNMFVYRKLLDKYYENNYA